MSVAHTFAFTGSGREYFGVWLVNFTLSVVTLGLYSPWAKVRRLQYFHRNTRLAGAPFDYHGDPVAILKGRIVAVGLVTAYTMAGYAGPLAGALAFAAVAVVLPWLLAKSLVFRLRNTSYRGVRFGFTGSVAEAYWVFLGLPVFSFFTLLLLLPLCHHRIKRYQIDRATWGTAPFHLRAGASEFYGVYLGVLGLLIAMGFGTAIVMLLSGDLFDGHPLAFLAVGLLAYGTMALAVRAVLDARIRALAWGQTWAGDHRVVCFIEPSRLFVLMATNLLATILTLGLFQPFAQIRMARYLADVVYVITAGSLDDVEAGDQSEIGAAGDESVGMLDFDIAL